MNYVLEYIQEIESGKTTVNKKVRKLYCDILKPIIEGKSDKY